MQPISPAVGAVDLIESAQLFDTVQEAVSDLNYIYAATARRRFMHKDYVMSRDLAGDYVSHFARAAAEQLQGAGGGVTGRGPRIGLMFGRESSGLTNEEVALAGEACGD